MTSALRDLLLRSTLLVEHKYKILISVLILIFNVESALWWDVIQEIGLYTTDELRMLDTNYRTNGLESP